VDGIVYIVGDEVRRQTRMEVPRGDVLALVDGDGKFRLPDDSLLNTTNLQILLTSPLMNRKDLRWLTQNVQNPYASYVVGPWQWNEIAITSFVT
jgi:hypothetical protein